jgi:ADP-ribose pyrophosphatase YjhB (NUDIX family)
MEMKTKTNPMNNKQVGNRINFPYIRNINFFVSKVLWFILLISLFLSALPVFGAFPSQTNVLEFANNCYLTFKEPHTFSNMPTLGLPYDNSLSIYWNMDDGSDFVLHDSSINGNNGNITGASWTNGRYGDALNFDGVDDFVTFNGDLTGNLTGITFSAWVKADQVCNLFYTSSNCAILHFGGAGFYLTAEDGTKSGYLSWTSTPPINEWVFLTATWDSVSQKMCLYQNGVKQMTELKFAGGTTGSLKSSSLLYLGHSFNQPQSWFKGLIDDFRVYNRALSAEEISFLYFMGSPLFFSDYYYLKDSVTDNSMLIYVNNTSSDISAVTCTNFFENNRLTFIANASAVVKIWNSIGKPVFTTGIWDNETHLTTLTLNDLSEGELNWNTYTISTFADEHSSVSSSNITVAYNGNQTLYFNTTTGYNLEVIIDGISQGPISNYTFSNVTMSHVVTVTSTKPFTITALSGENGSIIPSGLVAVDSGRSQTFSFNVNDGYHVSKILVDNASQNIADFYTFNNVTRNHTIEVSFAINTYNLTVLTDSHSTITPGNASVTYGETQLFNIASDSGFVSHVYLDGVDQGNFTSFNLTNVQENHAISIISDPIALIETSSTAPSPSASASLSSSPVASQTPQTSNSPLPSQTQQPTATPAADSSSFPTMTVLIAVAAVTAIVAFFGLSFKKGYITIETVDDADNSEAGSGQDKFKPVAYAGNYRSSYQMEKVMATLRLMDENITENAINTSGKTFSICVDGIYVKDSKILLLKRNVEPFKGYWHVAGGHVEENESLQDALKREFKEETGLDVKVGKIVGWRIEETPDRIKIILAFEVTSAEGEIKLNSEHTEFSWFNTIPLNSVYDYSKYLRKIV